MDKFVVIWDIVKIFLIPLCIWYFERQVEKRDDKREKEYNARKRQNQEEIDAILDKIRKSGYDSLSKEEKQKLFDASRQ